MRHSKKAPPLRKKEQGLSELEMAAVLAHKANVGRLVLTPPAWGLSRETYFRMADAGRAVRSRALAAAGGSGVVASGSTTAFVIDPLSELAWLYMTGSILGGIAFIGTAVGAALMLGDSTLGKRAYDPAGLAKLDPADVIHLAPMGKLGILIYHCGRLSSRKEDIYELALTFRAALEADRAHSDLSLVSAHPAEVRKLLEIARATKELDEEVKDVVLLMALSGTLTDQASLSPEPATARPSLQALWTEACGRHDGVSEAWGAIVTDPLAALDHSLLLDVTQPRTAAFLTAYGEAQDFRAIHGATYPGREAAEAYVGLARRVETAWQEAYRYSEQVGLQWLSPEDRQLMERAGRLLRLASDERTPVAERASAARHAAKLLASFQAFTLPQAALQALEATTRLTLPSGPKAFDGRITA